MHTGSAGGDAGSVRPFRFDALHAEALQLAEAARAYVAARPEAADPQAQLAATLETTRLVSRLGFCLAWLLARRAAASGEADPGGAAWRLGGRETLLAEPAPAGGPPLPAPLADLALRGARLYGRIDRLDRQLAAGGPAPVASPGAGT